MLTPERLARPAADWTEIAKEAVVVEQIKGTFYGFCSELAALRLFYKYKSIEKTRVAYSEGQKSWFFSLETNL